MNWKLAAVLLLTVACLAWVLWGVDLDIVGESFASFRWWVLPGMWLANFIAHSARCFRLRLLLGAPIRFLPMLSLNSIGFLAINVVPLRLGELVRPYLLREQHGVPWGRSLAVLFVERLLDFISLLVMLALVGVLVDLPPGGVAVGGLDLVHAGQVFAGTVSLLGLTAVAAVAILGEPLIVRIEALLRLAHEGLSARVGAFLRPFHAALLTLARTPLRALAAVVLTGALWVFTALGVWVGMRGVPGLHLGMAQALVVWALTLASFTLLPTPGFIGAHEAGCSAALRLLGVGPSEAAATALLIHLGQISFTIGIGLVFSVIEGLSLGEVVKRSRAAGRGAG
ncbi:MAG: lysylphosphatidylglycerol synthase transmembrane domain-containing protein [Pseudomonadota bacterium]